jgi:uncharacterized protein (TIGR03435 family)
MKDLLMTAFDVRAYQVEGPGWLDAERYDIAAKVPPGTTQEQVTGMWQNLLTERFAMKLHHESREFQVDELTIAKGGSKLQNTIQDPAEMLQLGPPQLKNGALLSPGFVLSIFPGANGAARFLVTARAQTVPSLAARLTNQNGRPIIDKTGLTGMYDFTLSFAASLPGVPQSPANDSEPDFATALEEQLGLKLVPSRAKLDVVVIDSAERLPSSN